MKKALPIITLLCYLLALAGCIAHLAMGITPNLTMIVVFLVYIVGVLVLMTFFTRMMILAKRGEKSEKKVPNEDGFERLQAEVAAQSAQEEEETESVTDVFADTPSEETNETEETEEPDAAPDEEAAEPEQADEEPESAADPAAEEPVAEEPAAEEPADENDENENEDEDEDEDVPPVIVVPSLPEVDEDEDDGADDEDTDDEDEDDEDEDEDAEESEEGAAFVAASLSGAEGENPLSARFAKSRYLRTYASRLIQADDTLKDYYSLVKNAFMSYKKVTTTVSREHERIRRGRITLAIMKIRGKTLLLYLALDPAQFVNTMYVGEDVAAIDKYSDVPFLYRIKGPRKAKRAVRLIGMIAEKYGLEPLAVPAAENYTALFPYESTEALVEKGLIIDKVAESERKAEAARLAAEEAEAAAQQAIDEAIKAKEDAEKAAARAEQTADEIEAAEQAKAAKAEEA